MTLKETPAVRHYTGWTYMYTATMPLHAIWCGTYKGVTIYASTERALKHKIDDWFDQQGD